MPRPPVSFDHTLPAYAELVCRSNFSFLSGASHPEELIARAQALRYAALAVTDECSLSGVVRAHLEAQRLGLPLIIGSDFTLHTHTAAAARTETAPGRAVDGGRQGRSERGDDTHGVAVDDSNSNSNSNSNNASGNGNGSANANDNDNDSDSDNDNDNDSAAAQPQGGGPRLVMLAMSRRGYGNLVQWITVCRRRAPKGSYRAEMADLEGRVPAAPMLAGLPGCLALLVVSCVLPPAVATAGAAPTPDPFQTLFAHALWLKTWFGDRAALALPLLMHAHDALLADITQRVATLTGLPVVAVGDVRLHTRSRKPLHDALTATRLRCTVASAGAALAPNAEAHLRPRTRLARLYRPEWLHQSLVLAGRCSFSLGELKYEYPREIVPAGHTPTSWLRALTEEGALRHYPHGLPAAVRAMIEHELALIGQLQYEAYFLTVADIVQWARGQGILCQGRGSAANSAVCYCLGVTAVDPEKHTMLLFERFISAERNEPPDIDIDFEHQRREEVIQYIYRKYGRHRAALTGVVISYRPRSALRDVGRALGIDLERIEAVSKSQHWWDRGPETPAAAAPGGDAAALEQPGGGGGGGGGSGSSGGSGGSGGGSGGSSGGSGRSINPERLRENGFDPEAPLCRLWMELTQQLIGFPRHLSQHPGGFVIARDTLAELVPVENANMPGRSVIQWDKDDLDALRLIKVDILALGMLSAIRRALALVGAKRGAAMALHQVPQGDKASYDMLCRGDSVGTFQVESRAQMSMLPRLKPQTFYDLVIEVAIVRPGPIQGGMVHPYLRRRNGEEAVHYPSEEVKKALQRTLGVPIFQEQVMQLAILAADFTPGEADQLRRAMAAWKRKGGLGPFHARLVGRMVEKGYEPEYAERIFKQIEGFGEYGFPESHAASFALLVYASAWLKCHHPDAFLAALLNSQPMGFYAPAQLVRDARAHGVEVRPVDVLCSDWDSTLEAPDGADGTDGTDGADGADGIDGTYGTYGTDSAGSAEGAGSLEPGRDESRSATALRPVRLGLGRISGFAREAAVRLLAARAEAPFGSTEDLARRAGLDAHHLALLAQADALRGLAGHRHQAAWAVAGVDTRATPLLRATRTHEAVAVLPAPDAATTVLADYRRLGLSLTHHPVALLRAQLARFKVLPAAVLQHYPHGRLARASGIVTHRQRPETARGVVFVTLEDDTGAVNVIVWPQVAEKQRRALLGASLLTVYGIWQCQGEAGNEVRHLVAKTLVDHTLLLQGLATHSRNFR